MTASGIELGLILMARVFKVANIANNPNKHICPFSVRVICFVLSSCHDIEWNLNTLQLKSNLDLWHLKKLSPLNTFQFESVYLHLEKKKSVLNTFNWKSLPFELLKVHKGKDIGMVRRNFFFFLVCTFCYTIWEFLYIQKIKLKFFN